ncbi:MAG: hypothetical protein M1820_009998 [Bogoriella megaspora]|nr:MAG: hypothetical protein M1820_009998 [Bogoriella megaspora]
MATLPYFCQTALGTLSLVYQQTGCLTCHDALETDPIRCYVIQLLLTVLLDYLPEVSINFLGSTCFATRLAVQLVIAVIQPFVSQIIDAHFRTLQAISTEMRGYDGFPRLGILQDSGTGVRCSDRMGPHPYDGGICFMAQTVSVLAGLTYWALNLVVPVLALVLTWMPITFAAWYGTLYLSIMLKKSTEILSVLVKIYEANQGGTWTGLAEVVILALIKAKGAKGSLRGHETLTAMDTVPETSNPERGTNHNGSVLHDSSVRQDEPTPQEESAPQEESVPYDGSVHPDDRVSLDAHSKTNEVNTTTSEVPKENASENQDPRPTLVIKYRYREVEAPICDDSGTSGQSSLVSAQRPDLLQHSEPKEPFPSPYRKWMASVHAQKCRKPRKLHFRRERVFGRPRTVLLQLPTEIRCIIWSHLVIPPGGLLNLLREGAPRCPDLRILRVNKLVHSEAIYLLRNRVKVVAALCKHIEEKEEATASSNRVELLNIFGGRDFERSYLEHDEPDIPGVCLNITSKDCLYFLPWTSIIEFKHLTIVIVLDPNNPLSDFKFIRDFFKRCDENSALRDEAADQRENWPRIKLQFVAHKQGLLAKLAEKRLAVMFHKFTLISSLVHIDSTLNYEVIPSMYLGNMSFTYPHGRVTSVHFKDYGSDACYVYDHASQALVLVNKDGSGPLRSGKVDLVKH